MAEVGGGVRKCWNCGQPTTDNDLRVCNDPICGQAAISLRERTIGQEQSMWDRISRKEITLCETCDAFFDYIPQKVFCDECMTNRTREYSRRPDVKAKKREYDRLPETRAKALERQRTPEYKAKAKAKALERQRTPEYKAKVSERMREYNKRPEVKERKRENARKYYLRHKKSSLSAEDDNRSVPRNWDLIMSDPHADTGLYPNGQPRLPPIDDIPVAESLEDLRNILRNRGNLAIIGFPLTAYRGVASDAHWRGNTGERYDYLSTLDGGVIGGRCGGLAVLGPNSNTPPVSIDLSVALDFTIGQKSSIASMPLDYGIQLTKPITYSIDLQDYLVQEFHFKGHMATFILVSCCS